MKRWILLGLGGMITVLSAVACANIPENDNSSVGPAAAPESPSETDLEPTLEADAEADAEAMNAEAEIKSLVRDYFLENATPNAPEPDIDSVRIVENYAIATWLWGDSGGQALLMNTSNQWEVITSSGGVLAEVHTLESYGVPTDIAIQLSALP